VAAAEDAVVHQFVLATSTSRSSSEWTGFRHQSGNNRLSGTYRSAAEVNKVIGTTMVTYHGDRWNSR
jgi:hypothetical protein